MGGWVGVMGVGELGVCVWCVRAGGVGRGEIKGGELGGAVLHPFTSALPRSLLLPSCAPSAGARSRHRSRRRRYRERTVSPRRRDIPPPQTTVAPRLPGCRRLLLRFHLPPATGAMAAGGTGEAGGMWGGGAGGWRRGGGVSRSAPHVGPCRSPPPRCSPISFPVAARKVSGRSRGR